MNGDRRPCEMRRGRTAVAQRRKSGQSVPVVILSSVIAPSAQNSKPNKQYLIGLA